MRDVTPVASHWWIVTAETGNGPGDLLYFWGRGNHFLLLEGKKNKNPLPCETDRGTVYLFTGRGLGNHTDLFLLMFPKNGQFQLQLPHTLNVEAAFRLDFS